MRCQFFWFFVRSKIRCQTRKRK